MVTELLLSLFVVTAPSLILTDTTEPSASLTPVIEPSRITAELEGATGFTDDGTGKIPGATEIIASVVIRERIHVMVITGSIFLILCDMSDNFSYWGFHSSKVKACE